MITVRAIPEAKRRSIRHRLFGVYADGVLILICTTYPSWATKEIA